MTEDSPENSPTHAKRVGSKQRNRSLRVLPSGAADQWPANLGELIEWYANEVEDVTRAAQLRLRDASKVMTGYRSGNLSFEEAAKRVLAHDLRWGQIMPGGIEDSMRGRSDEEIDKALDAFRNRSR